MEFTKRELHLIVVEFMRGSDDTFTAITDAGPVLFCVHCHRPNNDHSLACDGVLRLRLAFKAKGMGNAADTRT